MTEEERKERRRTAKKKWRDANPDYMRDYCLKNPEKISRIKRKWAAANKDYINETSKKRRQTHKEYYAEHCAKRRAKTKESDELTQFCFQEAKRLCKERENATGFKWHVDHIVPLKYEHACGLHTAFNFQVVPASWNFRKRNHNMDTYFPV
jgi:hypothetical protein